MPPTPGRMASPVRPPNETHFSVKNSKMPQPPSCVTPGKGAIPVEAFTVNGIPARVKIKMPDSAK